LLLHELVLTTKETEAVLQHWIAHARAGGDNEETEAQDGAVAVAHTW
jgi:hypothetical protein